MSELSKERLENYASGSWYPDADYVKAMARELLALRERAEPGNYRVVHLDALGAACGALQRYAPASETLALLRRYTFGDLSAITLAPPAPVVPDELLTAMEEVLRISDRQHDACDKAKAAVSACRAAMLQGAEPVQPYTLRDGWVAVPVEPTPEMNKAGWAAMNEHDAIDPTYRAMLAAAPDFREISDSSTKNFRENSETSTKCWCHACRPVTMNDARFVVCPKCGNKRCQHANDHRNACTGSNEPGQEGSAYPAAPHQEEPNRIHEERVKIQEEMAMGARLTKHRFKVK